MLGTPNALEILIHCHCVAAEHPRLHAPAVQDDIKRLIQCGLIELDTHFGEGRRYRTTDKGEFFINHLLSIPFPEPTFRIPENKP